MIQDPDKSKTTSIELRLIGLISYCLRSNEPIVRFVAVRYVATAFPENHVGSRYLLLLSTGDSKDEVFMEALKALYGTTRKYSTESTSLSKNIKLPEFIPMCAFVSKEAKARKSDERRFEQGNIVLPFAPVVYTEILAYLRLCLAQGADLINKGGISPHPNETTPLLGKYLRSLCTSNKKFDDTHPLKQYLNLIQDFMSAYPGK